MEQNMNNEGRATQRPLVMAYVPWQEWRRLYAEERGFERGTIFPALYYPFQGCEVMEE